MGRTSLFVSRTRKRTQRYVTELGDGCTSVEGGKATVGRGVGGRPATPPVGVSFAACPARLTDVEIYARRPREPDTDSGKNSQNRVRNPKPPLGPRTRFFGFGCRTSSFTPSWAPRRPG